MWRGTSSHGIAAATSSGKCTATSIANLHLSIYHSRNVVKRQERPLAVVVSSSDARACPHGLHRAGDLRIHTLAGQHALGRRRTPEAALWHTPRVGTRASHSASQISFPWTTRP